MLKVISTRHSEATIYRTENLERYLQEILKYPKLNREEERELIAQAQQGDVRSRDKLVLCNLKFVVSCAKEYQRYNTELMDLISVGNKGLIEAVSKYDLTREVRFISYAVWRIKAMFTEFIRKNNTLIEIPLNQQNDVSKLKKEKEELEKEHQCELLFEQVLNMKEEEFEEILNPKKKSDKDTFSDMQAALICSEEFTSMDQTVKTEEGEMDFSQMYSSPDSLVDIDKELLTEERRRILNNVLHTLPEEQQQILALSFGLEDGVARTHEDIALSLKKTPDNVRKLKEKGMDTLKRYSYLKTLY